MSTANAEVLKTITFKCTARVTALTDPSKTLGYYCPNAQIHIAYNNCNRAIPDHCDSYSVTEDQLPLWLPEFTSKTPIEKKVTIHLPDDVKSYSVMLWTQSVSPLSSTLMCTVPFEGKSVFEWTGEGGMQTPLDPKVWGKCTAY